jgi:hypothetical protein
MVLSAYLSCLCPGIGKGGRPRGVAQEGEETQSCSSGPIPSLRRLKETLNTPYSVACLTGMAMAEEVTQLEISQYTLEAGESACTAICCQAATQFLKLVHSSSPDGLAAVDVSELISGEWDARTKGGKGLPRALPMDSESLSESSQGQYPESGW